jgi:hypothetical protein
MSKIRIINGHGYGERGQSPDDYEIVGLDNVNDVNKWVTIKDRKDKTNNIKIKNKFINENWLKSYDVDPKKYIAALFELEFPLLGKRVYIMVGSGCLRTFETHGDEEIVSFFSTISSGHGDGNIPIVTIALGQTHMYIQEGGKVLPLSLFNRSLQYDKKAKDTYIDRMETDSFNWSQLQDLEGRLETWIDSKKCKTMSSVNYKTLEKAICANGTRRDNNTGECDAKNV